MKIKINAFINILNFLVFLIISVSGLILWLVLPGGRGFRGLMGLEQNNIFLGLKRDCWKTLHNYSGLILMLLVLVHLVLHWPYIKNLPKIFFKKSKK